MLGIQKLLINYNSSARTEKAKFIIIHDVGEVSSAKNNRDYFAGGDREASADFFVDSNNIIQIIDYNTRYSWAIGDGHGEFGKTNGNSVSVEMCLESNNIPSEQTIQNTLDLTHYLMNELGISSDNVVRHYDCSHKQCPGSFSANNWAKWIDFKAHLIGQPVVAPIAIQNIEELSHMFSERFYLIKYQDVAAAVKAKQVANGFTHYVNNGKKEGRQPCPPLPVDFNEGVYLSSNPDVAKAVVAKVYSCGAEHYMLEGFAENRKYK